MDIESFRGMGVAMVTPFLHDGKIDYKRLGALIELQIKAGTDFLVVLGTTAETPTIHPDERRDIFSFVRREAAGRIPLVAGIGGNCTDEIEDVLTGWDLEGFSAALSVVPFYNKPNQRGLEAHFSRLADVSPLPLILYNVPGRTGANMEAATTLRLANHPNVIGIKEASGNFRQINDILERRPEGFLVLSGDDGITLPLMKLGADGVISVLGNVCPEKFRKMVHLCLEGSFREAEEIHNDFHEMYRLLFADGNPAGIKAALHEAGLIENILRLPLVPVTDDIAAGLRRELQRL